MDRKIYSGENVEEDKIFCRFKEHIDFLKEQKRSYKKTPYRLYDRYKLEIEQNIKDWEDLCIRWVHFERILNKIQKDDTPLDPYLKILLSFSDIFDPFEKEDKNLLAPIMRQAELLDQKFDKWIKIFGLAYKKYVKNKK